MKLQYEKETVEQALNLLNGMSVVGLNNIELLAAVSALLRKYEIIEETDAKVGESIDS